MSHTPNDSPSSADVLLLIHGMAANRRVWDPLLPLAQRDWPGPVLAPDLSGHGDGPHVPPYGFGRWAAELAAIVPPGRRVVVLGHSLGGVVGALLASGWFGVQVQQVVAMAVKTVWSDTDIDKARALATAPLRRFATREEAAERYLRVSGLAGLVAADAPMALAGVSGPHGEPDKGQGGDATGRWRLAADPGIYGASAPGVEAILRGARCPVHHVAGAQDAIVSHDHLRTLDPALSVLPDLGHNLHVQAPQAAWEAFIQAWRARG